jgi:hypothetical protein
MVASSAMVKRSSAATPATGRKPGRIKRAVLSVKGQHGDRLLRAVFAVVAVYIIVSTFDVSWAPLTPKAISLVTLGVLYLLFELALERSDAPISRSESMLWSKAADLACLKVRNSSQIDIIASSSATFYHRLDDQLRELGGLKIRLILRKADTTDIGHAMRLAEYARHWEQIVSGGALKSTLSIRYSTQTSLRAICVDDVVMIGYYTWDEALSRYVGHSVPMIVTAGDNGQLDLFRGLFDYLWRKADDAPTVNPAAERTNAKELP